MDGVLDQADALTCGRGDWRVPDALALIFAYPVASIEKEEYVAPPLVIWMAAD